jgi:hypothetical protein
MIDSNNEHEEGETGCDGGGDGRGFGGRGTLSMRDVNNALD